MNTKATVRTTRLIGGSGEAIDVSMFALFVAAVVLLPSASSLGTIVLALVAMSVAIIVPATYRIAKGGDLAFSLLIPTAMACFQNVYLLFAADDLAQVSIRFLIIVNFLVALAIGLLLVVKMLSDPRGYPPEVRRTVRSLLLFALACSFYGFATALLHGAHFESAFASYRNFLAPGLMFLIGFLSAKTTQPDRYMRLLVGLAIISVIFGIYEWTHSSFWQDLGLSYLWEAKGIGVNTNGLPYNFYSSERIDGEQIRRMASGFADPVNFGTFLFAALAASWYLRSFVAAACAAVAAALAISKGALLSVLMAFAVYTRIYLGRFAFLVACAGVAIFSIYFYLFAQENSTGSTDAHIAGFMAALMELPAHPLGRGMGNVGVLSSLFAEGSSSGIEESGVGVILGQLGLPGIVIFSWLAVVIWRACLKVNEARSRVLVIGLLLAFIANATFNEVAMSPNSCAPYFIIIGLMSGRAMFYPSKASTRSPKP